MPRTVTYWFDRLGENQDVPPMKLDAHGGGSLVTQILKHAEAYLVEDPRWPSRGLRVERRHLGGFNVCSTSTGFIYGVARPAPQFEELPAPILPPPLVGASSGRRSLNSQEAPK